MPVMTELYVVEITVKDKYWTDQVIVAATSKENARSAVQNNLAQLKTVTGMPDTAEFVVASPVLLEDYVGAN